MKLITRLFLALLLLQTLSPQLARAKFTPAEIHKPNQALALVQQAPPAIVSVSSCAKRSVVAGSRTFRKWVRPGFCDCAQNDKLIRHTAPNGSVTRYQYDATGRIQQRVSKSFAGGIGIETFGYDPAGNIQDNATRLAAERATANSQRGYVKDNLLRVFEDKRYTYDGHGRLIKKISGKHTEQHFKWDDESHLSEVTTIRRPGTDHETKQTAKFDYDAIGRRIATPPRRGIFTRTPCQFPFLEGRRAANRVCVMVACEVSCNYACNR